MNRTAEDFVHLIAESCQKPVTLPVRALAIYLIREYRHYAGGISRSPGGVALASLYISVKLVVHGEVIDGRLTSWKNCKQCFTQEELAYALHLVDHSKSRHGAVVTLRNTKHDMEKVVPDLYARGKRFIADKLLPEAGAAS